MHSECSKVSYYQPKINIFFGNQQPKFCTIFFSKINPDVHFGTKINTFTFYKDLGAISISIFNIKIALRSQRNVKNGGFTLFYIKYYIPDAKIYPLMMWIQIHARGVQIFFLLKRYNTAHSECSQIRYFQPKNRQF